VLPAPEARAIAWLLAASASFVAGLVFLAGAGTAGPVLLAVSGFAGWLAADAARTSRLGPGALLVGALVLRTAAFVAAPATSDDSARYAWEAAVVLDGASPYAFGPDAPELASLRSAHPELHARVAHREIPAAHPPLALASSVAATLVARAGERVGLGARDELVFPALRGISTLWDLLVLAPLAVLARRRGLSTMVLAAWAWSPLVALEFAGAAHFDSLGIALLCTALAAASGATTASRVAAGAAIGAGAAVKLLPLAALPSLARSTPRVALVALACAVACYLPLAALRGGFDGLFAGTAEYALTWESTSVLFRWIDAAVRALPHEGVFDPRLVSRAIVAAAWLAVVAASARASALRATYVAVGAFLCLSPTLHPWYVTWIVPFLAFERSLAFRWLSAVAPLSYVLLPR
jgi:alpha-1,2-mannosyltransferase